MLQVNKDRYSRSDLEDQYRWLEGQPLLHSPEGKMFSLCLNHPLFILSIAQYLRERGGSLLLLRGDTPVVSARESSQKAGCHVLIYGDDRQMIALDGGAAQDTPSLMQYSSGTTGEPKLIVRSWQEIQEEIVNYNRRIVTTSEEAAIILVPAHHSFGFITGMLAAVEREALPIVITDKNPKFAIHMIRSCNKSITYGVPFLLNLLMSFKRQPVAFDRVISSGAPMPASLLESLNSSSNQVWSQYGCSECGCISVGVHPETAGSVGKPLDHLRLSLEPGQTVPQEIAVFAYGRQTRTGDLGLLDEAGELLVMGRMDDLINVSGLKVIPSEVERVIDQMPGVKESVVFRGRHPVWGEAVKALVVTEPFLEMNEVREWCLNRLPPFKVPHSIEFRDEIPKLPSGKVSRKLLIEMER
ncbi:fatty-acyl-CoA synthase [Fontibacillus phaseoli]|uniref:Fatty-acyl-CoA synthase n=1 Tax=Fontibacillus phaseoli TaxID=1416533 RepID=A0A369B736_9BACL|nr:AMP-binding protein [Fontibacillus phaseoli]RCX17330.1 fatty-acyl-CoA synthase [Fontibacillus phaseoli]